ncbi:MAG: hypothetical protein QW227_00660 [Candidatus Aenigmatarchaeota archaeon]
MKIIIMQDEPEFEKGTAREMTTCTKCDRDVIAGKCSGCGLSVERCTCEPAEVL